MELECRQETLRYWETVCRAELEQEESGETIVPDACPDVEEVLMSEPRLLLQRREAMDGRAELSGLIRVGILYRPEGGGGPAAMEATLPFSLSPELAGLDRRSVLRAEPRILSADVHLINSRKLLVKVVYQLELEGLGQRERGVLSLVEETPGCGLRQKTGVLRQYLTVGIHEKTFSCQDTLILPEDLPDAAELLGTRARCVCTEARVIGDKLMCKGETVLSLLCGQAEGGLFAARFHLPFSQIMEAGEESEGGDCAVSLLLTELRCVRDPEDPRTFRAELSLEALGRVARTVEVPVLTDVYSTAYELETEEETARGETLLRQGDGQETVRAALEVPAGAVCRDVRVLPGRTLQRREGADLLLSRAFRIRALLEGENGPMAVETEAAAVHRLSGPGEGECRFTAELLREPSPEGLEVSLTVGFRWQLLGRVEGRALRRVALGPPGASRRRPRLW